MSSSSIGHSVIAKRYAEVLFACVSSKKETEELLKNMQSFAAMLNDSTDLQKLVSSPVFTAHEKVKAIGAIADKAKMGKIFSQFLMVLAENGRLSIVKPIMKASEVIVSRLSGLVEADITTSHELTATEIAAVQKSLSKQLGKDIILRPDVDKNILGGMKLRVGSVMIDDSVRTKLDRMERSLKNTQIQDSSLTHNLKEVG